MNRRSFLRLGAAAIAGSVAAKACPVLAVPVEIAEDAGIGPVPVVLGECDYYSIKWPVTARVGLNFYDLPAVGTNIFPGSTPLKAKHRRR